jgi:2-amino-4-hydroxy-6-hydroxymethyldihydropteridine diphosphokinase
MPRRSKPEGAAPQRVVLGLGSNVPHGVHGRPEHILAAATEALRKGGFQVEQVARVRQTAPIGPSLRCYANGAVLGQWNGDARQLLALAKQVERQFGRRRGRRWAARVLDIDLWVMGSCAIELPGLTLPHRALAQRDFALVPLVELWADWRHPRLGLTPRQLLARLKKPRPVDFAATGD